MSITSSNLIRWGGVAALVAGLLLAGSMLLHPDPANQSAVLSPAWPAIHTVLLVAVIALMIGLIGIYAALAQQTGWLGLSGFVLTFIGLALLTPVLVLEAFVLLVIAASEAGPVLLADSGPLFGGGLGLVFMLMAVISSVGNILFGLAIAQAKSRWAGIAFFVGGPLLSFSPPLPHLVGLAGALLLSFSLVWLGYRLFYGTRAVVTRSQTTA